MGDNIDQLKELTLFTRQKMGSVTYHHVNWELSGKVFWICCMFKPMKTCGWWNQIWRVYGLPLSRKAMYVKCNYRVNRFLKMVFRPKKNQKLFLHCLIHWHISKKKKNPSGVLHHSHRSGTGLASTLQGPPPRGAGKIRDVSMLPPSPLHPHPTIPKCRISEICCIY